MFRLSLLLVGALVLAGCATPTPAERAARAQAEMAQLITIYGPACDKLGFQKDTDNWRDCVLRLATREDVRYSRRPTSTTCFGNRTFLDCTTF
jgi:hypothetical protein